MPKRPSSTGSSPQHTETAPSQKRVKVEEINAKAEPTLPIQTSSSNVQSLPNISAGSTQRDPDYYFEDGNVIFRVKNVLFKVHAYLLKRHSKDFERTFDVPQAIPLPLGSRGSCDEYPIIIPDVQCRQFRHLMQIIYCQPTDRILLLPPVKYEDTKVAARDYTIYVDVARLSRRFAMNELETWAKERLAKLAHLSGGCVRDGFADLVSEATEGDEENISEYMDQDNPPSSVDVYNLLEFPLLEAVQYARDVSDSPLRYDCLNLMQDLYDDRESATEFVLAFLRIPNLRETEPSLFGCFFLLILSAGNGVWVKNTFTQMDRMALFSAQSFLTPLPDSLKTTWVTPLFKAPSLDNFILRFSDNTVRPLCIEECYHTAFSHWQTNFKEYYKKLADRDPRVPIKALTTLPFRRQELCDFLLNDACTKRCYRIILIKTDKAIEDLYTRLAEYYKPIN